MRKEKIACLLKILFIAWLAVVYFFYYKEELMHNLDHLPAFIQKILLMLKW